MTTFESAKASNQNGSVSEPAKLPPSLTTHVIDTDSLNPELL